MISDLWTIISLFLGLTLFIVVGSLSIVNGDELIWSLLKAIVAFILGWFVLNVLGGILFALSDKAVEKPGKEPVENLQTENKEG